MDKVIDGFRTPIDRDGPIELNTASLSAIITKGEKGFTKVSV